MKLSVSPGDRQFVRDVLISGLQFTDPDLVRQRIRNLDAGQPLSQSSLTESQRRLYDLGIFARVNTALQNPDGDESYKYVLYRIEEARKYFLTLGVGAQIGRIGHGDPTLFDSPAGSTGFSPRASIGISRTNVFGIRTYRQSRRPAFPIFRSGWSSATRAALQRNRKAGA